jgi:hypothetical protein
MGLVFKEKEERVRFDTVKPGEVFYIYESLFVGTPLYKLKYWIVPVDTEKNYNGPFNTVVLKSGQCIFMSAESMVKVVNVECTIL